MKISIITVCKNNAKTIEKTIKSVINQNFPVEYIVIDGNSTDGTKEIIEKYIDKIDYFISEEDKGMYHALNKGIKISKGSVIGQLNGDDFYADKNIIVKVAKNIKDFDAVYGNVNYFNNGKIVRKYISPSNPVEGFRKAIQPAHPAFFCKKNVYNKFGFYNTNFKIGADYELLCRFIYKNKISCRYLPECFVFMKDDGISNHSIKNIILNNREVIKASRKNGLNISYITILNKLLKKFLDKHLNIHLIKN